MPLRLPRLWKLELWKMRGSLAGLSLVSVHSFEVGGAIEVEPLRHHPGSLKLPLWE